MHKHHSKHSGHGHTAHHSKFGLEYDATDLPDDVVMALGTTPTPDDLICFGLDYDASEPMDGQDLVAMGALVAPSSSAHVGCGFGKDYGGELGGRSLSGFGVDYDVLDPWEPEDLLVRGGGIAAFGSHGLSFGLEYDASYVAPEALEGMDLTAQYPADNERISIGDPSGFEDSIAQGIGVEPFGTTGAAFGDDDGSSGGDDGSSGDSGTSGGDSSGNGGGADSGGGSDGSADPSQAGAPAPPAPPTGKASHPVVHPAPAPRIGPRLTSGSGGHQLLTFKAHGEFGFEDGVDIAGDSDFAGEFAGEFGQALVAFGAEVPGYGAGHTGKPADLEGMSVGMVDPYGANATQFGFGDEEEDPDDLDSDGEPRGSYDPSLEPDGEDPFDTAGRVPTLRNPVTEFGIDPGYESHSAHTVLGGYARAAQFHGEAKPKAGKSKAGAPKVPGRSLTARALAVLKGSPSRPPPHGAVRGQAEGDSVHGDALEVLGMSRTTPRASTRPSEQACSVLGFEEGLYQGFGAAPIIGCEATSMKG